MHQPSVKRLLSVPVLVAALGYFVDIYDLLLFGIVRIPSLRDLNGCPGFFSWRFHSQLADDRFAIRRHSLGYAWRQKGAIIRLIWFNTYLLAGQHQLWFG